MSSDFKSYNLTEVLTITGEHSTQDNKGGFDQYMQSGLAYSDYDLYRTRFVYALHEVIAGKVAEKPTATCIVPSNPKDPLLSPDISCKLTEKGMLFAWQMSTAACQNYGIKSFRIERESDQGEGDEILGEIDLPPAVDGKHSLSFEAKVGIDKKSRFYRVTPVTYFGKTLVGAAHWHSRNRYKARKTPKAPVDPATIKVKRPYLTSIGLDRRGNVSVNWSFEDAHEPAIKGFKIVYRGPGGGKRVTDLVKPGKRRFLDTGHFEEKKKYDVEVIALCKDGKEIPSQTSFFTYRKPIPVPTITDLNVKRVVENGRLLLLVDWKPPAGHEVYDYQVYIDDDKPGVLVHMASMKVKNPPLRMPISGYKTRPYTVGIEAFVTGLGRSDRITSTIESVRSRVVPKPQKSHFTKHTRNAIYATLEWTYDHKEFEPYLKGFRVLWEPQMGKEERGSQIVANETVLGKDARSLRMGPFLPGADYFIRVAAVDIDGLQSHWGAQSYYRIKKHPVLKSKPSNLLASYTPGPHGGLIKLSWSFDPKQEDLISHYEISAPGTSGIETLQVKDKHASLRVKEGFFGRVDIKVDAISTITNQNTIEWIEVSIPQMIAAKPASVRYPRKFILIACGIASFLIFAVLLRSYLRRPKVS